MLFESLLRLTLSLLEGPSPEFGGCARLLFGDVPSQFSFGNCSAASAKSTGGNRLGSKGLLLQFTLPRNIELGLLDYVLNVGTHVVLIG